MLGTTTVSKVNKIRQIRKNKKSFIMYGSENHDKKTAK